ncbi:hypothetical protein B0H13DRAFT_1957522 [Mycena leptocephala]|nr:hypothetical protein B0H13DRAFT_1957522 [Mycena leptocephala]
MDKHIKAVGLPVPAPTVVISAEYESLDRLTEMLEDPALQKLLAEFDDFGFRTGATAFAADVITKIDAPGATADTYLIAIYNRPPHLSAEELAQKMEGWMERISALPVRDRLSSYSLWLQNDAVDNQLQALGYPAPEPLVVIRADTENLNRMIEIFEHSEVVQLLTEGIRDLGYHRESDNPTYSCCFSADVATMINNY